LAVRCTADENTKQVITQSKASLFPYPNPFNTGTTTGFSYPDVPGNVRLEMIDVN